MAELTDRRDDLVTPPQAAPEPGAPDADADAPDPSVMSLVDHLSELRRRIIVSIVAFSLASVLGFLLAPDAIRILKAPIPEPLYFTAPGSAFMLQLKVAVMIGAAIGSPVALYELWAFVSPGLTARERRLARPWIPLAVLFTVLGVGVAYVILPLAAGFLLSFQIPGVVEPLITADAYFGFVTTMFIAFGLVMQFPIVLVLLNKVGIISLDRLRRSRRYVLLGIFIFAVVVTPGGDPFSPTIMALVMYPLYELTIFLVARTQRPSAKVGTDD
jgi:sec-independent protein translocase protein TatC